MNEICVVMVMCESHDQAARIAEAVVNERLAACVNVSGSFRSCYTWEGKRKWTDEVLCLMKTTTGSFAALRDRVKELHTYSVPEILALPVLGGLENYMTWVRESCGPQPA